MLLGVASFAFAAPSGVNPLCSMIEALVDNWGIILWLVVGLLGIMILGTSAFNLTQGKLALALVIVIGGAVILLATYRLMSAAGSQLEVFRRNCQAQIEVISPVAKR
jgi:uncharacterized membrane protein YeaQ/YmgE (transglycosylase-associated protein family)